MKLTPVNAYPINAYGALLQNPNAIVTNRGIELGQQFGAEVLTAINNLETNYGWPDCPMLTQATHQFSPVAALKVDFTPAFVSPHPVDFFDPASKPTPEDLVVVPVEAAYVAPVPVDYVDPANSPAPEAVKTEFEPLLEVAEPEATEKALEVVAEPEVQEVEVQALEASLEVVAPIVAATAKRKPGPKPKA